MHSDKRELKILLESPTSIEHTNEEKEMSHEQAPWLKLGWCLLDDFMGASHRTANEPSGGELDYPSKQCRVSHSLNTGLDQPVSLRICVADSCHYLCC